jgi:DNA-binding transcriptional LysR family regulator
MKNLRLLEFAVALGHHRHFARAARALGVSQPTLSRGLARLERDLGVKLFERTTRSVEPTALGLAFLDRAAIVLRDAASLGDLGAAGDELHAGHVTVGAGPYALELSVLPAVARLAARHPRLGIRIIEGHWRALPDLLLQGALDLAVMHGRLFTDDQRVEVEPLPRQQGRLVCRVGHPLTRLRRVSAADVEPYPLVGPSMSGGAQRTMGDTFFPYTGKFAIDALTGDVIPKIMTTSMYAAREIVKCTDGVGLFVDSQIRDDVAASQLTTVETEFAVASTAFAMVWRRDHRLTPAAARLMDAIREVASGSTPAHAPTTPIRPRSPRAQAAPGAPSWRGRGQGRG